jgi:hypothetical protein
MDAARYAPHAEAVNVRVNEKTDGAPKDAAG